ncbi:uncharacterized protein LOC107639491 isoform X1 [Arachis ipaensis]|uniref:uncharacterized protein LOC107639491 isoform X1 n=1 Tax=Arachis ipaensis TaxID=130454 RepID=UPI000A2B0D02|nr:uncharacterized protein LOC107639491 isoform X1 [Arachis ipaensis]XP_020977022.1 uncharacterized protein LOC107639491 isoform X1 [Arachis ipaensis]XP_020977023.1 uncharacterized protein LOC107639491 isoform X1 [Arachis ipaensis]XP_020977024.1 uncharacterized protein LOC107639491 isoform X1 [Arachis ipaensis]XP_020977025.1 uncharacterized protein LOC107639491 isoform X1 [Arachis ipaensis]XP_020977026.1 uncharacterized protein LOC107639491 isoform X1 [Arachis ipaensis]XP_020977027.1 uncharac
MLESVQFCVGTSSLVVPGPVGYRSQGELQVNNAQPNILQMQPLPYNIRKGELLLFKIMNSFLFSVFSFKDVLFHLYYIILKRKHVLFYGLSFRNGVLILLCSYILKYLFLSNSLIVLWPLLLNRLQSELMALMMSRDSGISAFPEKDNIFCWKGKITGSKDLCLKELSTSCHFRFPMITLFKAPKVKFESTCFHPNVDVHGNFLKREDCSYILDWIEETQR